MIRITYTEDAAKDLEQIYQHIAQDNIIAAERVRQRLTERCEGLLEYPRMGRKRDEISPGFRSVTEGDYVILYRLINGDTLAIMRVIYGMRDLGKV